MSRRLGGGPPRGGGGWDVAGLGHGSLDHVCVVHRPLPFDGKLRAETYFRQPGGQVPTALVALQRWGWRTTYLGILGDDECGRVQEASLAGEGVDVGGCVRRAGASGQTALIVVDAVTGERSIAWHRPPDCRVEPGQVDLERVAAARVLLLDGEDEAAALAAARRARRAGALVVLDMDSPGPGAAALLAQADVAAVSLDFARALTGVADPLGAARRLRASGAELAVVTLGAAGAWTAARGGAFHTPAFRVLPADTTSAGDLFHAGLIHALLEGADPRTAVRTAAAAAALECTGLGGRAAIPPLDAVRRLAGAPAARPRGARREGAGGRGGRPG